jgi:hypothetical protein
MNKLDDIFAHHPVVKALLRILDQAGLVGFCKDVSCLRLFEENKKIYGHSCMLCGDKCTHKYPVELKHFCLPYDVNSKVNWSLRMRSQINLSSFVQIVIEEKNNLAEELEECRKKGHVTSIETIQ